LLLLEWLLAPLLLRCTPLLVLGRKGLVLTRWWALLRRVLLLVRSWVARWLLAWIALLLLRLRIRILLDLSLSFREQLVERAGHGCVCDAAEDQGGNKPHSAEPMTHRAQTSPTPPPCSTAILMSNSANLMRQHCFQVIASIAPSLVYQNATKPADER
jgi:hypothetical protein